MAGAIERCGVSDLNEAGTGVDVIVIAGSKDKERLCLADGDSMPKRFCIPGIEELG